MSTTKKYDFIIVGAGPSGISLAHRLASTPSSPSILLLEAGGENKNAEYLIPADRYALAFSQPDMNWGYKTVPQKHLNGQEIDYSRGRGLGGSTAINFSCWIIGAEGDFDEWARKVDDPAWNWKNVKKRFQKIEAYHCEIPTRSQKFLNPKPEDHGTSGPIHLSYANPFEKGLEDIFLAAEEVGLGTNPDVNSGNPLGMGMGASNVYKGKRTTASDYLTHSPQNLHIVTNSPIARLLFSSDKGEEERVVGVETINGEKYFVNDKGDRKGEVVLSAGALNSPQILMLSGIGQKEELKRVGIDVKVELDGVGKNMQDHAFSTATIILREGWDERGVFERDVEGNKRAREEHLRDGKDGKGVLSSVYCSTPMGWFKNKAILESREFKNLPEDTKRYISEPTVPSFEIATHTPPLFLGHEPNNYILKQTDSYLTALSFVMNPQSKGTVTLASKDPKDKPLLDPRLCEHEYDRRVLVEGMRNLMKLLRADVFKGEGAVEVKMVGCPAGDSEEEIWDHCKGNMMSSWHMCSTVKMGKDGDKEACVDTSFRVKGTKGLRVVDLSVLPLLPNNHTQSTAYLVGETAAEKMIEEYGLDKQRSNL